MGFLVSFSFFPFVLFSLTSVLQAAVAVVNYCLNVILARQNFVCIWWWVCVWVCVCVYVCVCVCARARARVYVVFFFKVFFLNLILFSLTSIFLVAVVAVSYCCFSCYPSINFKVLFFNFNLVHRFWFLFFSMHKGSE